MKCRDLEGAELRLDYGNHPAVGQLPFGGRHLQNFLLWETSDSQHFSFKTCAFPKAFSERMTLKTNQKYCPSTNPEIAEDPKQQTAFMS